MHSLCKKDQFFKCEAKLLKGIIFKTKATFLCLQSLIILFFICIFDHLLLLLDFLLWHKHLLIPQSSTI